MNTTKVFYLFGPSLEVHVDTYLSWVESIQSKLNITAITSLTPLAFIRNYSDFKKYKSKGIVIIVAPNILKNIIFTLYMIPHLIANKNLVFHLRKRDQNIIKIIKMIKNKVKIVVEVEGDAYLENKYLIKEGFVLNKIDKKAWCDTFKGVDGIITVTDELLISLKENCNLSDEVKNFLTIPTGFDKNKFYFDKKIRILMREKLYLTNKPTFIYLGNVHYPWQNFKKIVEIFKIIKSISNFKDSFLICCVPKKDIALASEILCQLVLDSEDFILLHIEHDEVNLYLNAADFGFALRDNLKLNRIASPGKIGEYLGAGLRVITTSYVGTYSKKLKNHPSAIIFDDFKENPERLGSLILNNNSLMKRSEISRWAIDNFSTSVYVNNYVNFIGKCVDQKNVVNC
jgi:hypothetical protein